MRKSFVLFGALALSFGFHAQSTTHVISNAGFDFTPDYLEVQLGDTVSFQLSPSHDAKEVSQTTWNNNGNASNGGFAVGLGGGIWVPASVDTFYYVCTPHAGMGMKGRVVVKPALSQPDIAEEKPHLLLQFHQERWVISGEHFTPRNYLRLDLQGRVLDQGNWPENGTLALKPKGLSVVLVQGENPVEKTWVWLPE